METNRTLLIEKSPALSLDHAALSDVTEKVYSSEKTPVGHSVQLGGKLRENIYYMSVQENVFVFRETLVIKKTI